MNLPNKLSLTRMFLIPVVVALFYMTFIPYNYLYAAIVYVVASVTDFLDGYIARKYNLVTNFGKFIDPIADKILVLASFIIMLTVPEIFAGPFGCVFGKLVGGIGVTIIVGREMIVTVLRMLAAKKGMVLAAEMIGKVKTFVTDICIPILMIYPSFVAFGLVGNIIWYLGMVLYVIAVILTIISGLYYTIKNKAVFAD